MPTILQDSEKYLTWNEECEEAINQWKRYLGSPPLLNRATAGERLFLYLAVSPLVVSSVLIREDQGVQRPVYFTSKALHIAEEQFPWIEMLALVFIVSAKWLRPYFQVHTINDKSAPGTQYTGIFLGSPWVQDKRRNWSFEPTDTNFNRTFNYTACKGIAGTSRLSLGMGRGSRQVS
jgi:hypothetical protein